ncbi:hypothetical protein F2Q70_00022226 [Brassica cretica]|uniref:Uncharacterized protein n=1 Tax=Brassica cretica TaxID=69181 RepID=A0A8S9GRB0_BRACR|nr:hypothetical protein F2Q70_00022226 [Brassica cretica]
MEFLEISDRSSSLLSSQRNNENESAHDLGSPSIDVQSAASIDAASSSRQLPLARQTDHSSVKREKHIRPGSRKSKPGGRTLEAGGGNLEPWNLE